MDSRSKEAPGFQLQKLPAYPITQCLHSRKLHPGQPPAEAGLAHVLKHFAHLRVLAEKLVHFLNSRAGPARDPLASAAVDDLVMRAFARSHGVDNGFDTRDLLVI